MTQSLGRETAEALVAAMQAFDPRTAEHLRATAALSARIAIEMKLEERTIRRCWIAAMVHDVGMLECDRLTLHSDTLLTEPEISEIEQHVEHGGILISRIPALSDVALIVRGHHERVDGTGYPDALEDSEIPLEARILSVADAFHRMITPSSYRTPLSPMTAAAEIFGNSGTQFDRNVTRAFLAMIDYRATHLQIAKRSHAGA
jgi:polar amino acid transport system substrate-binding protein